MNRIYNEIINNYISKDSDFAIQIDGSWGCGKTYYIQNELLNVIQNTNKRPIWKKNLKEHHEESFGKDESY